ncbi:MAG: (Fe-S)-binding protein, partial [Desulfatitalea sp.]
MSRFQNLMEVLKVLPKTNCRQCREKTCLAFSAVVFKGEKELALCPYVAPEILEKYGTQKRQTRNIDEDMDNAVNQLKQKIRQIDLAAAAGRIGSRFDGHKLTLKVMGKEFSVDANGTLF